MKDKGLLRHDSLVDRLESELFRRGYQSVYKNTEYSGMSCGEIDLWAKKDDYVLLFEMKSSDSYKNRKKAREQLGRAERNCFPYNRVFKFYVCNYRDPVVEWVRGV